MYRFIFVLISVHQTFYFTGTVCNAKSMYTCVSVNSSEVATSNLFGLDRYLFCLKCFSNSKSCLLVNAVLGLRDLAPPIAPEI